MVEFILATGTLDLEALEFFSKCLDEGAETRHQEDEDGWGWKRRRGDTQSNGTWKVQLTKRRRNELKCASNLAKRFWIRGWNIGAKGTISLLDPVTKELRPLSDFPGRCCGEVHGDRIHGKTNQRSQVVPGLLGP